MAACTIFFLAGQVFIAHLGIEDDEALFAGPIFEPRTAEYAYRVGHSHIPLMLMSYLGTLKTLLYRPILGLFGTGPWAVREPALLMGAAGAWLFFLLLGRVAGYRAALIGCCLLAADSLYLVTTVFDWGPVALQHLLVTGGLFLLVRFYQTRGNPSLAAGCFLFGLAMWDKALAMWMLSGIGIAGLVIFWRQIFAVITFRRGSIAALAFVLGALPLILYNVHTHLGTLHENPGFDTSELAGKARMLVMTIEGPALFGLLADEDWQAPQPHQPNGFLETAAAGISTFAGHPTHSLMLYAFVLSLLLAPLAGCWRFARDSVLADRDGRRVGGNGCQIRHRRQRPSLDSFVAASLYDDCGVVRGGLAAAGPCGRGRDRGHHFGLHDFGRPGDKRILRQDGAKWRSATLE